MNLEPKFISLIQNSVRKFLPDAKIFIFGSRVRNTNQKFSDVDIAILDAAADQKSLALIRYELEESDLPYKTDVVNYNDLDNKIHSDAVEI